MEKDTFKLSSLLGTLVLSFKKLLPHCVIDMTLLKTSLNLSREFHLSIFQESQSMN